MLSLPNAECKLGISSEHRGERPFLSVFCLSVYLLQRNIEGKQQSANKAVTEGTSAVSTSRRMIPVAAQFTKLWHKNHHYKLFNCISAVHGTGLQQQQLTCPR